jgi:hypothetical protein
MKEIIFLNQEHEEFFYELIVRFKARNGGKFPDVYQQALAYTLSVNDETRRYFNRIFNMESLEIRPLSLFDGWQTSGSVKVTMMAFNLWNGFNYYVLEDKNEEEGFRLTGTDPDFSANRLFCCPYAPFFCEAIRLRYPENYLYVD